MMSWVAWCSPLLNRLCAVDDPLVAVLHRRGLEERGVGPVVGLGQAEGEAAAAVEEAGHPLGLLGLGAVVAHHQHGREVADDRALVLQVVEQPEALGGEVLADDRHLEVGGVAAAELGRQGEAEPAGGVGPAPHLAQQRLPLRAGDAAVLEVGARPLAPMVEEPLVVVLGLQRRDLALDEVVDLVERLLDAVGHREVHRRALPLCVDPNDR